MAKDYTDYVALVLEAEKRVFHIYHHRARDSMGLTEIEHNGRGYVFDRDRSFRVKWAPWKKTSWKRPIWSVNELLRGKKVGLLFYHEPLPKEPELEEIVTEVPEAYRCKLCDFQTEREKDCKGHVTKKHKGAKHEMVMVPVMKEVHEYRPKRELVQPIHISRIHQPSGVLRA